MIFRRFFIILSFSFIGINIFAQSSIISPIQFSTNYEVQEIKLIFMVDAFRFDNGRVELPTAWPHVPVEPVFRNIEAWSYPLYVRRDYHDRYNVVGLKEKINYPGSCEAFITDENVLQNYRLRVEAMQHLRGKHILVRLICLHTERIGGQYKIMSGRVNAMVLDTRNDVWNVWRTRHVTRSLTADELRILERMEF